MFYESVRTETFQRFFLTSLWMKKFRGRQGGEEHVGNFSYFPGGGGTQIMTYKEKLRPKGITPWARLKPFNYDRYSLSVSLAFAARIIICRLLKSDTLLETVPS